MRFRNIILVIFCLFLIRLLIQSQIVLPLYRCAWPGVPTGVFFATSGDTKGYTKPWINLIEKGIYSMDGTTPTVYRQPYPGLLFGICYLITRDETLSMEVTAVIQILLGSIAIYVMMLLCRYICEDITGNNTISYRAMYLYLILCVLSLHTLFYDGAILSDGFAIAFVSFFAYSYYQYLIRNKKTKYLLISGIFISLVTLYRPYYLAFYPILILHLGYHLWKNNKTISFIVLRSFYIVLPFIFMNLPWTIRNYVIFHKLIPFYDPPTHVSDEHIQTCTTYIPIVKQVITFSDAYYVCQYTAFCYFETHPDSQCPQRFPRYIIGKNLNMNEIENINRIHKKYAYSHTYDKKAGEILIQSAQKMLHYYKIDHPYTYWIWPRLYALRKFLIHGGTFYFPPFPKAVSELNPFFFISLKFLQTGLYWFCLLIGSFGLFYLSIIRVYTSYLLLMPIFLISFFGIFFMHYESRYFFTSYPILLLGSVFISVYLTSNLRVKALFSTFKR
jgi:hypothetical protein